MTSLFTSRTDRHRRTLRGFRYALLLMAVDIAAAAQRPNFVVIVADDWGFTDVGAFGSEIATPNLDALAAQGVRFSNFHTSAECSPTRAMLLTGVNSHRTGIGAMRESVPLQHYGKPGYLTVLSSDVVTFASRLQQAGYRNYAVGKWHVGKEPHNLPPARGFDRSLVQGDSGSDNWDTAQRYLALTDRVYWFEDGREVRMPSRFYSSEFYVDQALNYLEQDKSSDQPFLLYLAFQANHIPLQAPREFVERYAGRYDAGWHQLRHERREAASRLGIIPPDVPMQQMASTVDWHSLSPREQRHQARSMEVYAAMAEAMDHHLGRLIKHLKQSDQFDNTVFVFLSDNGAEASDPYAIRFARAWLNWNYTRETARLGEPGTYTVIGPSWASAVASPLAYYKFSAGEGGLRVPMIISGSAGIRAGAIHHGFTHVKDIAPTLLDLAGVSHSNAFEGRNVEPITGRSLTGVLDGTTNSNREAEEFVGYELAGHSALFKGDLKLLRLPAPIGDGRWRLYDILRDPGETADLSTTRPEDFASMLADYAQFERDNGVLPMPEGYSPLKQVTINSLRFVYLPMMKWLVIPIAIAILIVGLRRRQRAKVHS